jgi:hypothetical protein
MKKSLSFLLLFGLLLFVNGQSFVEVKTNFRNSYGGSAAWGDYDNDGASDLYISGVDSTGHWFSTIYHNEYGNLVDINAVIEPLTMGAAADWGDFDNDGDLDLLIAGTDISSHGRTKLYRNDNGIFSEFNAGLIGLRDLTVLKWGDYNGDKKLDILICGYSDVLADYTIKIYKNVNNSFVESNIQLPLTADEFSKGWIDYDGDGDLDIYLPVKTGKFASVFKNNEGSFSKISTDIRLACNSACADWADFDRDGNPDVVVTGLPADYTNFPFIIYELPATLVYKYANNNYLNVNANLKGISQGAIKWVDFNMDGYPDLFLIGYDRDGNYISYLYRNDHGIFSLEPTHFQGLNWANVAIGDYNNDNAPDILIMGMDSLGYPRTRLYKNLTSSKIYTSAGNICGTSDSAIISYVGDISVFDSLMWNFDGGTIINGSKNGPFKVSWSTLGEKTIKLILYDNSAGNDTLSSVINVKPGINVNLGIDTTVNRKSNIKLTPQISGGTMPVTYYWDGIQGDPTKNYMITRDSSILCKVTDANGCKAYDHINISIPVNSFAEEICLVTVDPSTNKNMVVWEKSSGHDIKEYNILKETSVGGTYSVIGTVPFSDNSIFTDPNTNPSQSATRYKLAAIDSKSYETGQSEFHQTIHLSINQGLPGCYNLIWTPYIGFEYFTYYIYRGSAQNNLQLIDSIANTYNQYSDTVAGIAYYQISVKKENPCIISSTQPAEDQKVYSVSNLEDNLNYVSANDIIFDQKFQLYPNPYNDELVLEGILNKMSLFKISIYSILGEKTYESISYQKGGTFKIIFSKQDLEKTMDMSILKIEFDNQIYFKKIIRK